MHLESAPQGGKFRAVAASALDGTAGAWGDGDMLCVALNSSGELIATASVSDCIGVIHTTEGRKVSDDGTTYKQVKGGKKYTVIRRGEFVEAGVGSSPALSEGDKVWAQASGDVDVTATPGVGSIFIGWVMKGGNRLVVDVNGIEPSTA